MKPVLTLTRFLSLFLLRRILRRGALRLAIVRWGLAAVALVAFAGFCVFGVVTLRQLISDPALLVPLLHVAGTAVPMWVLAIFTVVRVMFMKSSDLVELTFCFPLTNRARTLGFMLFEAMLVGIGVVVILGALVAGTISLGGPGILDEVIVCLVMPTCLSYLLAATYYLILERVLLQFRLARLRAFLVPVILAATLVTLAVAVSGQSERVLFAAVGEGEYFAPQLIFAEMADAHGLGAAFVFWLVAVVLLVALVCSTTPRQFDPTRRFARVPMLLGSSEFGAYFAAHIRAIETITVYGIVLGGSYALFVADVRLPPFLLIAVTIQGVYAYVSTEPLRASGPRRHGPVRRYLLVLGPQVLALGVCAVPVGLLSALTGIEGGEILLVVGFCASNTVVLTLAGIIFPPEKGNPFSVVVGVAVAALITGTLLLGANLLGLPAWFSAMVLVLVTVAAAALSAIGMQKIERIERHEVVV
ncbi:hypothetical protein [Microbacterium sp. SA39]|uniref:hypothetical protein n=1 Tax=Microbacterium sp. SA39 TaxID=1263625 RepID=UPI0005FA2B1B|nr:hypothetical protein [Microbacterium sp. SA39]KJQ53240.1 hypothetical protein RS85_02754 [Microbacterium sp. SA39]